MLSLQRIREQSTEIAAQLRRRGDSIDIAPILELDAKRRQIIRTLDQLQHERKAAQEQVAAAKRRGEHPEELLAQLRTIAEHVRNLEDELQQVE
jgi:seryl-tRNA synthetase